MRRIANRENTHSIILHILAGANMVRLRVFALPHGLWAHTVRPYMLYHYREVVLQFPGITLYLETAILLPVLFSHRKFHELDSEIMKF